MIYFNKVTLVGNLTKDPELRSTQSGTPTVSFTVITNRIWRDNKGIEQRAPEYHGVVVFGKEALHCSQQLRQGQMVLVSGRLQTRSWDDRTLGKRYKTEIVAELIQFGERPDASMKKKVEEDYENFNKANAESSQLEEIEYPQGEPVINID